MGGIYIVSCNDDFIEEPRPKRECHESRLDCIRVCETLRIEGHTTILLRALLEKLIAQHLEEVLLRVPQADQKDAIVMSSCPRRL